MSELKRIAITMGDPAGVGPELSLRALERGIVDGVLPVVFGDRGVLKRVGDKLGLPVPEKVVNINAWALGYKEITEPCLVQVDAIDAESVMPGRVNADTGHAAYAYIESAIATSFLFQVCGVATGPIHKEALQAAGIKFPGHTEIFANKCHIKTFCMMLTAEKMTCTFATLHMGYAEVPEHLTRERIEEVIDLTHQAMSRMLDRAPRLTVLALNPHAGEGGLFGDEEQRVIFPAIEAAREKGFDIDGPIPPDTAFLPERLEQTDAYVCMYHDQGHIPLKMTSFDEAVNVTLGLPIVRTSVAHGTALDVAWQGTASPNSLFRAIDMAAKLFKTG